jgi:hypothetical protein
VSERAVPFCLHLSGDEEEEVWSHCKWLIYQRILSSNSRPYSVICEALFWMEIKDPYETTAFKYDQLVIFMLAADVRLKTKYAHIII